MNTRPIDERAREYYGLPDTKGVLIQGVTPGGPADKGGVRSGDIIRKVDGEIVENNEDLLVKVAGKRPGEKVRLEIFRNGETVNTEVVLAVRPADPTAGGPIDVPDAEPEAEEPISFGFRVGAIDERMRRHTGADETVTGVMIVEVDAESDAAEQGLVPGLIIQSVNDRPVTNLQTWRTATRGIEPGDIVKIELWLPGNTTRSVFVRVPDRSAP